MKLFPKNIYIYKKVNNDYGICTYICNTDSSNEIIVGIIDDIDPLNNSYIKLENGLKKVLYTDRFLTLKTDSITNALYIKGNHASLTSSEFQILSSNIYKLLLLKYEKEVEFQSSHNFSENSLIDITMPENLIKLLTWNLRKINLKFSNSNDNLKIMEHCIYFAYLGNNIGTEINKLRPVLVWKKHENKDNHNDDCYYIFPLSTKKSKKNYRHNVSFYTNGKYNKIMINQGRVLSKKRFIKIFTDPNTPNKVFKLDDALKEKVKSAIKSYFGV